MSYKEICIDLNSIFLSLPISIIETDKIFSIKRTQYRNPSIIFRARENEVFLPQKSTIPLPFKFLKELSIIPESQKHKLITFGRCNKPKEPRFYASSELSTAVMESLTEGFTKEFSESRGVTVGLWEIKQPLILAQINYSEKSLTQLLKYDKDFYEKLLLETKEINEAHLNQLQKDKLIDPEYAMELFKIFADEFSKTEIQGDYDYMISNYYCDHVFDRTVLEDGKTTIDGILYPSVSHSYQESNLVLHPRALNKLNFISAMNVWVVYHGEGTKGVEFSPLEQNIHVDDNGQLNWKQFNWVDDNPPEDGKYPKPLVRPHGQGFLTIGIKLYKERILTILHDLRIEIKKDADSTLEITLTQEPEKVLELYCGLKYNVGTLNKYIISEEDDNIVFLTPWGFLTDFKNEIIFSIDGKIFIFKTIEGITIGFIHAPYNSEKYHLYQ
ncbi:MAG: RES domain-containing protein [Bacteroidales bacterium]|jgi:hypothetical protein